MNIIKKYYIKTSKQNINKDLKILINILFMNITILLILISILNLFNILYLPLNKYIFC